MTKSEAAVVRAAMRYWRARKNYEETRNSENEQALTKLLSELLASTEAAFKEVKDWVSIQRTADPNQPVVFCAGCEKAEALQMPRPMNEIVEIMNVFRGKHIECGPVGEEMPRT